MKKILSVLLIISGILAILSAQENLSLYEKNWPEWRGPYANGTAPAGNPPIAWSESSNVKWKVEIPGKGHATPIVWEDQIILLSAVQTEEKVETEEPAGDQDQNSWMKPVATNYIHKFVVVSVNRHDGKIRWQTTVREDLPHGSTHEFGSWASNSPVTDGEHIYAYFGSKGLYCLDMDGAIIWERDFGTMEKVMSFGEGSSPVLHKDKLIILRDHEGQSTLHIMDKNTGKELLKIDREEPSSWATPLIVEHDGKTQVITGATNKIRSYDLADGRIIWECGGLTRNVIPSPVSHDNMVYLMSGYRGNALLAIDLSRAKGDITGTDAIIWRSDLNTPYAPSPVLMDGRLFFLKLNNGFLSCRDAADGKEYYSIQKLDSIQNIFASPVGVMDRIYIPGANGFFYTVKAGNEFDVLSLNRLDDQFHASPAIKGDNLYLRGFNYLYCIAEEQD